jgi:MFS transporter, DHA1 family, multidrug resistance protein
MASPIFIAWFFFLPETSASNILLRRAARLRKISGNDKIRSQTEIDRKGITPRAIFMDAVVKPFEISIKDPAVLFTNVYTALTYGIYYSFFEVFPLVYGPFYGFNLGETGLVFLAIVMGCFLGMAIYFAYLHFRLIPGILNGGLRPQEWRLRPALPSVIVFTLSLFAFGMTVPISGVTLRLTWLPRMDRQCPKSTRLAVANRYPGVD